MSNFVTGSAVYQSHSSGLPSIVPSAGTLGNRLFFVGHTIEWGGGTDANTELTSITMRGETAASVGKVVLVGGSVHAVQLFVFTEAQTLAIEAGSGDVVFSNLAGVIGAGSYNSYMCFTIENAVQAVPAIQTVTGLASPGDAWPHSITFTGATAGETAFFIGRASQPDTNTWTGATEFDDTINGGGFATTLASFSVVSSGNVTAGITADGGTSYVTSILAFSIASPGGANTDPVLDTPQADISVPANTSGTIADISGNFSDADSDTLTYSVSPALPTGMTLNVTTGVISGNSSITVTAAANYTFTADDAGGGTLPTDIVSIEVTALVNLGLRPTLRDAEASNALIASETGLTVHIYDTDGGTELLTTTAETTDASGVLEIDSDAIGSLAATVFIVAKRSNGQTCCGTVTIIDLDA